MKRSDQLIKRMVGSNGVVRWSKTKRCEPVAQLHNRVSYISISSNCHRILKSNCSTIRKRSNVNGAIRSSVRVILLECLDSVHGASIKDAVNLCK